ncbi:MAG: thermonuclease family protein [Alphaproteobacteria bacterium TMED93]|mgnify:CR=1 FL=1|nr:MAG: thermonuclease family protein [Alphaproteobacteria bacterium TMED93]|tara:strand:+ start:534 stop:1076 length:543 start_codon:yes stop_codon:yes gene_type:complete
MKIKFRNFFKETVCFTGSILFVVIFFSQNHDFAYGDDVFIHPSRLVKVVDGDTIRILDQGSNIIKVRLAGIDAPEITQQYGIQSRIALKRMLKDRKFTIQILNKDRYGRSVGIIYIDQLDVNHNMIKEGNAWAYRKYLKTLPGQKGIYYIEAETTSKLGKKGLWAFDKPLSPWLYRRQKR